MSTIPVICDRCRSTGADGEGDFSHLGDLLDFTPVPRKKQRVATDIEIDELYIEVNSNGAQFIVPVQAKGGSDRLGVIQTIQDITYCREGSSSGNRYKHLKLKAVSTQFMADNVIAMFELDFDGDDVSIVQEKHYQLVEAEQIEPADLKRYLDE
jgi:hypothetical protein